MSFKEKVYEIARKIPSGKVATYGQIAKMAGQSKAARVVGYLMRTNPFAPEVPCHRVVGADGGMVGFSAGEGLKTKKQMLVSEGVVFKGNRVDLGKSIWGVGKMK